VEAMQRQYPGIIHLLHQDNSGAGAARQAGFEASQGEFIQFLDSDDLLMPRKFELQVEGLQSDLEAGISYGPTEAQDEESGGREITHGTDQMHREIFPAALKARIWHTVTPLYRRSVCQSIGPWSRLRILEDWEYDCRAGVLGIKLNYVKEVIAVLRHHLGARLGWAWRHDASAMRDRIAAYVAILDHAVRAGISNDVPEMQFFVRSLFWMAREAGAYGLSDESRQLFHLARRHAVAPGWDYRLYGMATSTLGWIFPARIAAIFSRLWK